MEGSQLSQSGAFQSNRILSGGGKMGQLMRSIDWAETPLGPVTGWSQSLRTSVSICLNSRFPILIWWGPDLIMLYNDAYRPILGATKHPKAMGQPGRACWPEIWHIIGPMLEGVITNGQATWSEDQLLLLDRNGFLEECYFTFSYSPIHDENDIAGAFTAVTETTGRVVSERRMSVLAELSTHFSDAKTEDQIYLLAIQTLAKNVQDVPFAAFYLLNQDGGSTPLVEQVGLSKEAPDSLPFTPRGEDDQGRFDLWPFAKSLPVELFEPDGSLYQALGMSRTEPGIQPITEVKALPIGNPDAPMGYLVVGLSPYRTFDEDYYSFLSLVTGQIASALATVRALEEERKRAEALAELDRAKTEFFSNISHEFRTPITLMLGPVQDALSENNGDLSIANRERFEIVHRNGLRLLKLVNTLLDFSRIEADRMKATFQPVDLAAMTVDLASVFRSTIEHAHLRLEVNCPPLPEPIYVDPEMWEKIVLNLISNAFKYTFEGKITLSLEWKGQYVELQVADTGTGIAQEEIPLIFERFHRIEGARARSVEGSGIGLALVQELVHLHGGSISVTSLLNQGSTFCVSLPTGFAHLPPEQVQVEVAPMPNHMSFIPFIEEAKRWLPESQQAPNGENVSNELGFLIQDEEISSDQHQQPQKPPEPARILLADDNADMRDYLRRLLSSRWTVEAVSNGPEALHAIQSRKPDLVLSDIMMPGFDGFELLRRLREDPETRSLPIILVSARAGEESRLEGLEYGADDYLVKPFSAREMLARVEACLELNKMRGEMQRKISGILESLSDAFWAVDHHWRITYANQPARQMLAGKTESQNGTDLRTYFQSELSEENWRQLALAMQERQATAFEQYQTETSNWFGYRAYPYESGMAVYAANISIEKANSEALRQIELQRRLLENREKERQEIARDIHDGPIQTLVSVIFNAQFAKDTVQEPIAKVELEQIGLSLKGAVRELREVVNELRPPALIRFGLAKTIRVYITDFQEKYQDIEVQLDLDEDAFHISEPVSIVLYRIFQEGMNNIVRHSEASKVWVRYHLTGEKAVFEIQDNGKGFIVKDSTGLTDKGHFGLAGMKERIETIHGDLQIQSAPNQGTLVRVTVPMTAKEE